MSRTIRRRRPGTHRYAFQGSSLWINTEPLTGKQERVQAKRDLRRGIEPQPKYHTGNQIWD